MQIFSSKLNTHQRDFITSTHKMKVKQARQKLVYWFQYSCIILTIKMVEQSQMAREDTRRRTSAALRV